MEHSRREICFMLPALLALKSQAAGSPVLPSKAYPFDSLSAQASDGNEFRPVFDGTTHDGFHIALHETDLAPGTMPHPPHHHVNEEIFLIREGTVQVTINGHNSTLHAGGVAYVASGEEHGIRNTGDTHARYFVFELGSGRQS